MRQGINTELIRKGRQKLRGLFEGDMLLLIISKAGQSLDFGSMMEFASVSERIKCLLKTVNYKEHVVEKVNVQNFKYLLGVYYLLVLVSYTAFYLNMFTKLWKQTRSHLFKRNLSRHSRNFVKALGNCVSFSITMSARILVKNRP